VTKLLPLAVQNADVLRVLDRRAHGVETVTALAAELGRDESNLRKTLKSLIGAGVLEDEPLRAGLTPEGRAQLAAIERAEHGGERRKSRGRWPVDKIVRNPANRIPRAEDVAALADTIEAARDVLQNVQLTPPDANGVRMLLAGEHRWLATRLLADQDRLPEALTEGLPFREREADPGERLLIAIVENTARTDLSPLEDARLLRDLQAATGWSAREIAKKTGRSPQGSETGVRDVQSKIKVAREASAEAIADHEAGRIDWSELRETVMSPRHAPPPAPSPAADPADQTIPGFLRLLAEPEPQTDADPLVVNGVRHPNLTRANEARRMAGLLPNPSNHASGARTAPAPPPTAGEEAAAPDVVPGEDLPRDTTPAEDDVDDWGRDHNARVADRAVLTRVTDFVGGVSSGGDDHARRLLFQGVGVSGPFAAEDANVLADVAGGLQPRPVLTVDVDAEWPPERAQALAALVAWVLQQRFGQVPQERDAG
jgi:DNA-binding MarR family transcriptional regulator